VDAHPFRHLAEFQPVRAVAIAQQIPRRMVPRKCLQKLSGGPLCRGVCGHRKMHQTSTVMAENHEREQQLERDGGHDEEIARQRARKSAKNFFHEPVRGRRNIFIGNGNVKRSRATEETWRP
jgi:hypothetical protein